MTKMETRVLTSGTGGTSDFYNEIVISGIAGRFPDSDNIKHFQENLFNKVDLISDDDRRWKLGEFLHIFLNAPSNIVYLIICLFIYLFIIIIKYKKVYK